MPRLFGRHLLACLICAFGVAWAGASDAFGDESPPNLDNPPPNTDGTPRSRNFTRVTPGGGPFDGYTPYTVNGEPYQLDTPVTPPPDCETVSDGSATSEVRSVRVVITGTQPNLETRPDGEHAVFNSYLRAIFDFSPRDPSKAPPEVTTELKTRGANFFCWVEGTPQPGPGVHRVHSPNIASDGPSHGGDPTTHDADGPVYVGRTNGDLDVNLGELKDDLQRFTGEFVGTKRVYCQVTIFYELRMNRCVVARGSYIRSFETSLTGRRSLDDENHIEYQLGIPQSGGMLPEPEGPKAAEIEKPPKEADKDGTEKTEDKEDKKVGFVPGGPSADQKEYAYKVALQFPDRCVATTYVRRSDGGTELSGLQTGGQPVFEVGQGGGRPISAGPPPEPEPNRPQASDGDDQIPAGEGRDEIAGRRGKDEFIFVLRIDPFTGESRAGTTLDDGDRITDYEFGETITIEGQHLKNSQIQLEYDANSDETRLGLDLDEDGEPDRTVILEGNKVGTIRTHGNCCAIPTTEIVIEEESQAPVERSADGTPPGSAPGSSDKAGQPAQSTQPKEKTESAEKSDKASSDQSAVPQSGARDSDLGLVKAEAALVSLLVKGEETGQPIQEFTWKLIDEDPQLPADPKQPQPPARVGVAENPYKAGVTGGQAAGDGRAVLVSADPSAKADQAKSDAPAKTAVWEIREKTTPQTRLIVGLTRGSATANDPLGFAKQSLLDPSFNLQLVGGYRIGDRPLLVVTLPSDQAEAFRKKAERTKGVEYVEPDPCWKKEELDDPYFTGKGAWGQDFDDQWALKRAGYVGIDQGAWKLLGDSPSEVIVAVIDSGLDWEHPDIAAASIWRNKNEIPDNGRDDDGNGYIDDVIGWDFVDGDNKPWDHDGHGTFVSGVIAAAQNNGKGITGINPHARIMVLRALDPFGQGHASMSALAIAYAADNGARVINLSLGGPGPNRTVQLAIDHARQKGAVVVVAAGNSGADVSRYAPSGLEGVITVSASDRRDRRAGFSNWGPGIDIAAPGVDVLSLRARKTDLLSLIRGVKYEMGSGIVGDDGAYYRASGTSFAAPFVTGTLSLILSRDPKLTGEQAARMVLNSARDIETPGIDNFTGYGLLDAVAALKASPDYFLESRIAGVDVVRKAGRPHLRLLGTVDADAFAGATVEIGKGENPDKWSQVEGKIGSPVRNGPLKELPASLFRGDKQWTIRLITRHRNGSARESRFSLKLG